MRNGGTSATPAWATGTRRSSSQAVPQSGSIASWAWPVQGILRVTRERAPFGRWQRDGVAALTASEVQSPSSKAAPTLYRTSCLKCEAIACNSMRSLDKPAIVAWESGPTAFNRSALAVVSAKPRLSATLAPANRLEGTLAVVLYDYTTVLCTSPRQPTLLVMCSKRQNAYADLAQFRSKESELIGEDGNSGPPR